ncbi:MAG TPA: protein kinase, partial [Anaerolineales bacterium]
MTELIGKTLGNYRMDRLLGEGGMGSVYQAYDLALQREVAIKLIHPHLARREDFRERFIQEARMMARLDHPGIVRVYVLGREGDLLFLPMEFIKGGNLRQLLDRLIQEKKWLPLNEALLLVKQLCQVVDYAHRHGVLHRDIKPANLMLKPEPTDGLPFRVILTDLGLAKLLEGLGITQEGTSLGTPAYMSPEQASGRPTDPRSDVYSLGILLYELAVGRLPFAIRSITEATRYHTEVPPPAPRTIRPELPEALERVILKALEKEPDKRYASAAGLAEVLSGSLSFATEIIDRANQDSASLVTEYQASMVAAPGPAAASLMTFLGSEPVGPRGSSVFGDQSIAPSSQTRIQIVHKEHTAKTLTLPSGTITIGRGKDNHIVLDDDRVSRRHAQITWDGLEYHVMDLNSSNGTYLENAKLLAGMSEIFRPGQNLRIGDTWLRLIPPATQTSGASQPRSMAGGSPGFAHSSAGLVGVSVEPKQLTVEAGGSATITLSLLNQSPNVDHFSISLTGIPADWVTSLPAGVQLMPKEQKEAAFDLHVPRSPQSQAGPHPIKIKVTSQRDPSESVEVKLVLTVAGYSQFSSELEPQKIRSGQTARLIVSNQGNLQEVFSIQFKDAANELAFQPPQIQMRVPAGETAAAEFQVQE